MFQLLLALLQDFSPPEGMWHPRHSKTARGSCVRAQACIIAAEMCPPIKWGHLNKCSPLPSDLEVKSTDWKI